MKNLFFFLGYAFLTTHELDAVSKHEWRVLPLTSWLPDETGFLVFLFAHIPLFAILTALVASSRPTVRIRSRVAVSLFLVLHAGLHLLFAGQEIYEFTTVSSNILIFGGAVMGVLHLAMELPEKQRSSN